MNEELLRESLKRCPEGAIEAAIQFQSTRDQALVPIIVLGIIERYVEPEVRPLVRVGAPETRLAEDLGIDSLLMVEIVMLVEETLGLSIENEELRGLSTLGDLKTYLSQKIDHDNAPVEEGSIPLSEILKVMPQQHPFLFLQSARIVENEATGHYSISGNEDFLKGHFRDEPVFPASLMIEALGQLAVLFIYTCSLPQLNGAASKGKCYFVSCNGVRCHKICRPGETLHMTVRLRKIHTPLAIFEGNITRNGERVAVAEEIALAFGIQDKPTA